MHYTKLLSLCPLLIVLAHLPWSEDVHAEAFIRPPADVDLIGEIRRVKARHEDTLLDIARRFDVGQEEILLANPGIDRWIPGEDRTVTLPTRYILPKAERTGVVLNVAEMRLYYFPPQNPELPDRIFSYPVSIGRMDWSTPLGKTRISSKTRHPSWRPPASIREAAAEKGEYLPEIIPPGPDNPLGDYALRLAIPGYLIHSTNKPYGVGMRVSHGCVRMYPEDIAQLFPEVPVGTPVRIVNQPVKIGWLADTLYIEVHPPLDEEKNQASALDRAMDLVNAAWYKRPFRLDAAALKKAVREHSGMPVAIAQAGK